MLLPAPPAARPLAAAESPLLTGDVGGLQPPPKPSPRRCRLLHAYPRGCSLAAGCGFALIGCVLTVLLWRDVYSVAIRRATADADADATTLALAYKAQLDQLIRSASYIAASTAAEAPHFDISTFREVRAPPPARVEGEAAACSTASPHAG